MGYQTVSDESGEDGSGDENTELESEDEEVVVEEEEEEAEEEEKEPNEEDPDEEDPDEIQSGEEPGEDSNDDNLREQELDEVGSCEVEPDEENSCEKDSHAEEPDDKVREGVQNVEEDQTEESCELISDDEGLSEEEQNQESCEEEPVEEEEEPCEEPDEEPSEEEPVEEPCDEDPNDESSEEEPFEDENEPMEEEEEEEEEEDEEEEEEEEEEEPDDDPDDENNEGSDTAAALKTVSELSVIQSLSSNVNSVENLDSTGITRKKRPSRWDEHGDTSALAEDGGKIGTKKKKSRWSRWSSEDSKSSMESPLKPPGVIADLEVPNLLAQLFEITNRLQSGVVGNRKGILIYRRERKLRSKLKVQRQEIISKLIEKIPNFKPPPYIPFKKCNSKKPCKLQKKLYIPCKEYPEYNFVGLIIGPCGNTKKRMEEETGAKIFLRGKGSMMKKPDHSDTEDLHVLIVADDKYSLDTAVAMVEKLLIPVDDGHNVHKLSQLRELAQLKGNFRGENTGNFKKHDPCNTCGEASHPTSACPLTAPTPGTNAQQVNFLAEIGGALAPFTGPALSSSLGNSASYHISQPKKEIDDSVLYIGFLPQSVDDSKLCQLFSPFGLLLEAKVIRDKNTGLSKGYGFVKYRDHVNAATAVSQMNRYKIDGKMLSVQIKGITNHSNNTGSSSLNKLPTYPGPALAVQINNPDPMQWPGPPESKLPETIGNVRIAGFNNYDKTGYSSLDKLPTYPGPALAVKNNTDPILWPRPPESKLPVTVGSGVQIAGVNNNTGFASLNKLPTYPGPALAVTSNPDPMLWPGPQEAKLPETVGSVQIAGFNYNTGFSSLNKLPTYPGSALAVQNNPRPMSWPGPPASKLPEAVGCSLPYSTSFQISSSRHSGTPPTSASLFSHDFSTSNEFSQLPGYLKSLNPPSNQSPDPPLNHLYHHHSLMPSSLSSSSSSAQDYFSSSLYSRDYFTKNYGSNQRPPT